MVQMKAHREASNCALEEEEQNVLMKKIVLQQLPDWVARNTMPAPPWGAHAAGALGPTAS